VRQAEGEAVQYALQEGEEVMRRLLCGVLVAAASMVFAPSAMAALGLQSFEVSATNPTTEPSQIGFPDVQAGSHPDLTTSFVLSPEVPVAEGSLKDVRVELPPGFVGNPEATPRCTYYEFVHGEKAHPCPDDTAVGVENGYVVAGASEEHVLTVSASVYNIESSPGVAAELGFRFNEIVPILLDVSVRTGGDYGLTVKAPNISEAAEVYGNTVTVWGVPAEPIHDPLRGKCLFKDEREGLYTTYESTGQSCPANVAVKPFLTNPTSCGAPRTATLSVDSWEDPGSFVSLPSALPELSGCEKLDFSPSIEAQPDGTAGSTPTGLNVHLHVPQEATLNPVGLAEADVKDTTVTLPAGVQLSPSAADGLQACSQLTGKEEPQKEAAEEKHEVSGINLETKQRANCPEASKVANVKIKTPLLEGELEGSVYLAAPQNFAGLSENPFSSLVALYLVAEEPKAGVLVKLAGKVSPNPETGQLTTTFENTPQLPFSDLKLEFYGTDRAPLATPALCGTYTTETSFVPWSAPESGSPATPSSSFHITSGPATVSEPNGTPCPGATLPFSPSLESGTTNINAGSFSPLTTTLSREDGQQSIQSVTLHYPAGLSGLLSNVKLCGEAQANAGTCGPESEIGETVVSVGLGNDPFSVTGGKVYITGPYEGAPFGLSIVNPAKAGPFDLQEGRPVIVRAKIEVNPTTAALTVTTNTPAEGYAIPSIIEGIPLQIKHVNVNITRPGFTFNPTSCSPMQVTGSVNSAEGASSPVSIPFQVTNCASLKFAPQFKVSTSGKTSKADGASLTTKVEEPAGSMGTQANITRVKVELPKALPSRLTTLQKACTDAQFELNPANCPAESDIGYAVVHTPLIPVPLEGPAIFVSHGGEAFPSLTMLLQGYGVKIDLVGTTFISKAGITSTTFKTVPDQPFNTFELTLPEKQYSALAANGNLCNQKLAMPTEFVGQNGAEIHESTTIAVEGCPSALAVVSSRVKRKTLTLSVYAPGAGKVTASGKSVTSGSKTYGGREALTFTLKQRKAGRLETEVKLTFTPSRGQKQSKEVRASFRS
jgi:hypothetical protein